MHDLDLKGAGQQPCYRCGADGMHHRFCACKAEYAERTESRVADASLCAVCSKLLTPAQVAGARMHPPKPSSAVKEDVITRDKQAANKLLAETRGLVEQMVKSAIQYAASRAA
eukprot:2190853-Pleurochrysis_carterae.AAC.2